MVSRSLLFSLSALLLLPACKNNDDQIQTYRVSKESDAPGMPMAAATPSGGTDSPPSAPPAAPMVPPMMGGGASAPAGTDMQAMGAGMSPAGSAKEVEWKVPSGWQEQTPSSMRIGSFLAKGDNGQSVDISVVPLSGDAGGDLANVNRWRGQINLQPMAQADLPSVSETIHPAGREMLLVDIVSREPLVDNRFPKRLIAAVYKQGNRTWFFKMMGEDKAAEEAKPAFIKFLKSLQFHAGQ